MTRLLRRLQAQRVRLQVPMVALALAVCHAAGGSADPGPIRQPVPAAPPGQAVVPKYFSLSQHDFLAYQSGGLLPRRGPEAGETTRSAATGAAKRRLLARQRAVQQGGCPAQGASARSG